MINKEEKNRQDGIIWNERETILKRREIDKKTQGIGWEKKERKSCKSQEMYHEYRKTEK